MMRSFLKNRRGNFAIATAFAIVPILGGLALAIDFSEMARQRQETLNALDAANLAAARRLVEGATDEQVIAYAKDFFEQNLSSVKPANTTLTIVLPANNTGGGTLKMTAGLKYAPYFFPTFTDLVNGTRGGGKQIDFLAKNEVRLKNTLEVALVLDNSGSMAFTGTGSGQKRIDLLKTAAKQLVDTLAGQASQMKQIAKPVQFSLVPFAASVNVGPNNATASWMDTNGISPIHHENFAWPTTIAANKEIKLSSGNYRKIGTGWPADERNTIVTRFTLFDETKYQSGTTRVQTGTTTEQRCSGWGWSRTCWNVSVPVYADVPVYSQYAGWQGCVESRPHPYNTNDATPTVNTPATLFVPMFRPDETDNRDGSGRNAEGNWWGDVTTSTNNATRQRFMAKYFDPTAGGSSAAGDGEGPNGSCTTKPITPLTDVTASAGLTSIKAAIDAMAPLGATNVPEGMAWGWRTISGGAPFTEGRPDIEKGNDKVVIVLTDGQNTYYAPSTLDYNDLANNKSTYSSYGYTGKGYNGTSTTRMFMGTSSAIGKSDYTNANYTAALNEQFQTLCTNAKAANLLVMTVALDLSSTNTTEKAQIDALTKCSSDSRFQRNSDGTPKKLFYNATGSSLADKFKEIADELSNLRIVS